MDVGGFLVQLAVSTAFGVVGALLGAAYLRRRRERWGWVAVAARQLSGPRVPGLFPVRRAARSWHPRRLRASPGVVELGFPWGAAPTTRLHGAVARATGERTPWRWFANVGSGQELVVLEVSGAVVELAVDPGDLAALLTALAPPTG